MAIPYQKVNPLDWRTPIVDPTTGMPTDQFIRIWQQMFLNGDNTKDDVTGKADKSTKIIAGTGLTGGGDLSADRTLNLADTAVTPGTYGDATHVGQFTVDQQGRLTAATAVPITGGGGGGVGPYPYWQIRCLGNQSNFFGISDIKMASSVGGTNLCTGGTASANLATYGPPADAFDGNPATFWAVDNKAVACWIAYHFTSSVTIVEVTLQARSGSDSPQCPTVFAVEGSNDGINWKLAWTVQTAPFTSSQIKTFDNTT